MIANVLPIGISGQQPVTRPKALISMLVGMCGLVLAMFISLEASRAREYIATNGVVVSSEVEIFVQGRFNLHTPVVLYNYTVNGVNYENDAYDPMREDGTESWANSIAQRYPVGRRCTVYFDPESPSDSVLMKNAVSRSWYLAAISGIIGVACSACGWIGWRSTAD